MLRTQTVFPETNLLRSDFYARVNPPRFQRLIASLIRSWACHRIPFSDSTILHRTVFSEIDWANATRTSPHRGGT